MTQPLANPPEGSAFALDQTSEGLYRISWKTPGMGCARFPAAAFLVFWLCGWAAGEIFVTLALLGLFFGVGPFPVNGMNAGIGAFLLLWLTLWTFGGIAAMAQLYRLLRPPRPESVTLGIDDVTHDPGTGLVMGPNVRALPQPFATAPPRQRTLTRQQVAGLKLERVGERQRLTVDCGADRVEIGPTLREPEREWLAQVLSTWAGRPM
jgi:hypothetical protein